MNENDDFKIMFKIFVKRLHTLAYSWEAVPFFRSFINYQTRLYVARRVILCRCLYAK